MLVGAIGITLGLALYGPKLIRTVGSEITELDQSRAFCIAMAAAITVIIATQFGLPVSSTHIAVGAVFGVGFLREYLKASHAKRIDEIKDHHHGSDEQIVEDYLTRFEAATVFEKGLMLEELKEKSAESALNKEGVAAGSVLAFQPAGINGSELDAPKTDSFSADNDTALGK